MFVEHHNGIVVLTNIFTPDELWEIDDFLSVAEWKRQPGVPNSYVDVDDDQIGILLRRARNLVRTEIEEAVDGIVSSEHVGTPVRYDIGWVLPLHSDNYDNLPTYTGWPTRDMSSTLYLTGDFEGGELHFPAQNVRLKPNAGTAVFFPSTPEFRHEVTRVESGRRVVCTTFWHIVSYHPLRGTRASLYHPTPSA